MSKASYRRKVTSAKITDWVEPSFQDFFGSSDKVTSHSFGASERGNKKDESTLENPSQSKKRANPFSANHFNDGIKATSAQSHNDPWIDRYRPNVQADLAVHKKKVEEVETWLRAHADKKQGGSILLLTGPPGCGKTATILVLAKEMGIQVQEWINPLMQEYKPDEPPQIFDREMGFQLFTSQSQSALFQDFLLRANKYNKLQMLGESPSTDRKLIIVDDMPNQFYRDPASLHDIVRRFVKNGRCPLVFIISDSMSGDSHQRRLFPKEIQDELHVCNISFNPVAPTSMMKVLNRIAATEAATSGGKLAIPDKETLELLCSGCSGDIRSAINCLQFSALKDSSQPSGSGSRKKGKVTKVSKSSSKSKSKKKSDKADEMLAIGGKDAPLFLFRALGKILHCKREAPEADLDCHKLPAHLSHHDRDLLLVLPEAVVEKSHMRSELFNLYIHQNYLDFYCDIDDVVRASEYLSAADVLTGDWNFRSTLNVYGSSVASRGVIHCNSSRAFASCQSGVGFRPLHKPQWFHVNKKYQENTLAARELFSSFCSSPLCLQTQVVPYLAKLTNPLRNQAQIAFIQDVGRFPLKSHFGRIRLEALTDKDTGVPDADSGDEEDTASGQIKKGAKTQEGSSGSVLLSSQGGETDLPTSQPQPVTAQAIMEDEELRIEEFDSD
ncbi:cell cycle checkpoint protein RAD17 [Hyla sarda]|uniref:cell cycle checkpoint protein RAD17 n=1 Tax=Hyla sarda TaxID=327740 RepID=UPI0024C41EB6|nr:cell cycle checkpoint protein RAD17 [Hyla sarda]XP_056395229.1 cell cycle checkpoint protein RAD17 [Hyla sarda]